MKLLFLVHSFPPLEVSGSLRSRALVENLPHYGIYPVVVCGDPEKLRQHHVSSVGWIDDWKDNVACPAVTRIAWREEAASAGLMKRSMSRLPILASLKARSDRKRLASEIIRAGEKRIREEGASAIYCSVAPSVTAIAGAVLAAKFALPLVVDIRDPWSYGPPKPYRHVIDFFMERRIERKTLEAASLVVVPTQAARDLIASKIGVDSKKISVVANGFEPVLSRDDGPFEDGVFTLLYAGEIGVSEARRPGWRRTIKRLLGMDYDPMQRDFGSRSVSVILAALDGLFKTRPELRSRVRVRFLGTSDKKVQGVINQFSCSDRVSFHPRTSRSEADRWVSRADALLLLQVSYWLDGRAFCPAIPAKLYTYLDSGRPIIACAQRSEIWNLIKEAKAGWVIEPGDTSALASAIGSAYDQWQSGSAQRRTWEQRGDYSRNALAGKFAKLVRGITT